MATVIPAAKSRRVSLSLLGRSIAWLLHPRKPSRPNPRVNHWRWPCLEPLEKRELLAVLMGTWDTNGDGSADSVFNHGAFIRIQRSNGTSQDYTIGPTWILVAATDTDGRPGVDLAFNIGSRVRIVHDATSFVRDYQIAPTWSLTAFADTDGLPGSELVFNLGSSVRILHDSTGVMKDYFIAPTWQFFVAADTDGQTGSELVFNVLGDLRIVHNAINAVRDYDTNLGSPPSVFMRATETDGRPGHELLFNIGLSIKIFHEASAGSFTQYSIGSDWALMDTVDTNGRPGEELVLNVAGTVKLVRDADGSSVSHPISPSWAYVGPVQLDFLPGLELKFHIGGGNFAYIDDDAGSDTEAPNTTLTSQPPLLTNSTSATFAFSGTDNFTPVASLTYEASLNGAAFLPASTPMTLTGLASEVHTLRVQAKDQSGNVDQTPASYTWTIDAVAPTVDIVDVAPDPRDTSVSAVSIAFNEPVTGLDWTDLTLTRNGGPNLLSSVHNPSTSNNVTWTIPNLTALTGIAGNYSLSLAAGSGITDLAANPLSTTASDQWTVTNPILDNGSPGFLPVGAWSMAADQGFQNNVSFKAAGDGSGTVTWTFTTTPGQYRFAATWTTHANRATDAPFTIFDGTSALSTVQVDQEQPPNDLTDAGVGWEYLSGIFNITGSTASVRLSDAANQYVIADAVRLERVGDLPALSEIQVFDEAGEVVDAGSVSFGTTLPGAPVDKVFRVRNTGAANLTLQPVNVPVGFSVANNISEGTVLAGGVETTFTVRMLAATEGSFSGQLSFANTDGDENPFNFTISGTASAVRIIDDGDARFGTVGTWLPFSGQGMADDVHYVAAGSGNQMARWTFPITPGRYELAVTWTTHANRATNAPYTVKDGGQTIVFARLDQEQAPNDFTDEGVSWERLGSTLTLTGSMLEVVLSDDANQYVIADAVRLVRIGNLPAGPEVQVYDGASEVLDGTGSVSFGPTFVNVPVQKTFRVKNVGTGPLTLQSVSVPTGFSIDSNILPGTILASGAETAFTVQLNAAALGTSSGQISFSNDDADENSFNFAISGTVGSAKIIDDGDPGFSMVGFWSSFFGEGFQENVHYTSAGNGTLQALWTFAVSHGQYRVAATWSTHANRATNAPFTVFNGGSPFPTVIVNQELAPNDLSDAGANWQYLGGVLDITGSTVVVRITDSANEYVIADAIRLERIGNLPAGMGAIMSPQEGDSSLSEAVEQVMIDGNLPDPLFSDFDLVAAHDQVMVEETTGADPMDKLVVASALPPQHQRTKIRPVNEPLLQEDAARGNRPDMPTLWTTQRIKGEVRLHLADDRQSHFLHNRIENRVDVVFAAEQQWGDLDVELMHRNSTDAVASIESVFEGLPLAMAGA